MARLDIEGLCKGWDFPVLDELSFSVDEGEFFVIVGPSGVGKTTLLRLIAGLENPDAGKVLVDGEDVTRRPPYRRRIAMTFESYALYPHMTVYDNIASPLRARKTSRGEIDKRVNEVAQLLRIEHLLARKPGEVSGGQKQRTALGRTLVADPEVFLLDEPLSHLDAKIRHELRSQFHTLEALRKVASVYVTHDYSEALSLGDRIGVMGQGGRLIQVGQPRELFEQPVSQFVAEHLGQPTINLLRARLHRHQDQLMVQLDGSTVGMPVDPKHTKALDRAGVEEITLGLRPQHLRPSDEMSSGIALPATVDIFEALGSMGIMIAQTEGIKITALTSPERHFRPQESVALHADTSSFLYFDADSGRNLMLT
ncbi:MAG: ABC transporter ATP-binding protein [Burkholderiaceae bacterium]